MLSLSVRIPFWVAACLAILGVGLTGGYYLALYVQEQYAALLAGAVIFGVLTWVGSATDLLGFIRDWWKDKKEGEKSRKSKLRTHTKNLNNEVFKKLLDVRLGLDYKNKMLKCEIPENAVEYHKYIAFSMFDKEASEPLFIPVEKLPYFERAISHLKHQEYKQIYDAWIRLNGIAKEYVDVERQRDDSLSSAIKEKMQKYFPSFHESGSQSPAIQNHYHVKQMAEFIIHTTLWYMRDDKSPRFVHVVKKKFANMWVITGYDDILLESPIESAIDSELLQNALLDIVETPELLEKIRRWSVLVGTEIIAAEKTFTTFLNELVRDIEDIEDDYLIAGECERCPKAD